MKAANRPGFPMLRLLPAAGLLAGRLTLGPTALIEQNVLQSETDLADERIDTVAQAFVGLAAACARCHDHKFDPVPRTDYYALVGIFRSAETCRERSGEMTSGLLAGISVVSSERPQPSCRRDGSVRRQNRGGPRLTGLPHVGGV